MPLRPDSASLSVVLASDTHSVADVQFVTDALHGIVAAGIWGALALPESRNEDFSSARRIIREEIERSKARNRFYGEFGRGFMSESIPTIEESSLSEFDPLDPLDAGVRDGMNSFLRRTILTRDRELYSRLYGFAQITRAEHHSPLLLELGVALTMSVLLPTLFVVGAMRAAVAVRKANAEADIRETQAKILREEFRQKVLQTRILNEIAETAEQLDLKEFPKDAIAKAAEVATTSISDLGSNPLIGSLTFGFSTKSG